MVDDQTFQGRVFEERVHETVRVEYHPAGFDGLVGRRAAASRTPSWVRRVGALALIVDGLVAGVTLGIPRTIPFAPILTWNGHAWAPVALSLIAAVTIALAVARSRGLAEAGRTDRSLLYAGIVLTVIAAAGAALVAAILMVFLAVGSVLLVTLAVRALFR